MIENSKSLNTSGKTEKALVSIFSSLNQWLEAGPLWRILALGLLTPVFGAAFLCSIGSLWPIRFDYRALQDLQKLQYIALPKTSGDFVFLSRDNSSESAHIATFGLRQMAFPSGSVSWFALKEQCSGPWVSGFKAVDKDGNFYDLSSDGSGASIWPIGPSLSIEEQQHLVQKYIVFDSPSTRESFEQRWPILRQAGNVVVLSEVSTNVAVLRRPANEFTVSRIVRFATILGSYLAIILVLLQFRSLTRLHRVFIFAGALFLAVGVNLWLTYVLQWVLPVGVHWASAMLWLGLLAISLILARRNNTRRGINHDPVFRLNLSPTVRFFLVYGILIYAFIFLVRLDFDGDFFNNWLPQGRFHYLLGKHDPVSIIGQGSTQAASYPPGYGILLSKLMWASGLNPVSSFLIGTDTSFSILGYRLLIFSLNLALFALLGVYISRLGDSKSGVWFVAILVIMLLIPSTAGKHIASETLLLPMLGASMVMIAAGRNMGISGLTAMGLIIGGTATLIKWEATLLFTFAVLPWLVLPRTPLSKKSSRSVIALWIASLLMSLLPVILWMMTLQVHNSWFVPMTLSRMVSSMPQLPGLVAVALKLLLEDGRLALLLLALPIATLLRLRRWPHWSTLIVPLGVIALFAFWVLVFLFTDNSPKWYLESSYSRLVMVPTLGAILYCAEAVQTRDLF